MPQIIAHRLFKDTAENIDIARIFSEAPPEARVLRTVIGRHRILAMRKTLYERACAAAVKRPTSPLSKMPWNPPLIRDTIFDRLSASCPIRIPDTENIPWVFTITSTEVEAKGMALRVFDLLDWLNRADAYYDSLVDVKVEAY